MRLFFVLCFAVHLCLFFAPSDAFSAPLEERLPTADGAPLSLLSSQPVKILVPQTGDFADRLIIAAVGSQVRIIDTQTWDFFTDQPDAFDSTIGGIALLPNGISLIATLADGNLARMELDSIDEENEEIAANEAEDGESAVDPRIISLSSRTSSGPLGSIVADPDAGNSIVHFINTTENIFFTYNITSDALTSITLDSTPRDVALADADGGKKIFVPASNGKIFQITSGVATATTLTVPITQAGDEANPDLVSVAPSPDGDFVYVVDATNSAVWVLDASSNAFLDQQTGNATDPIRIDSDENLTLNNIIVANVEDPNDIFAYISGEDGLSVLDVSDPETATAVRKIIDLDEDTADVLDPLALSGRPGPLAASTVSDGYVYSANGNAEISIISDNPFVDIDTSAAISLDGTTTTFSLTFQADEAGTYRVVINSNISGTTGTELIAETALDASQVNTNVTTAVIDSAGFGRAVFSEGENRVFIFTEDSDGDTGRDAVDISVDRPPQAVSVTESNFGNGRVFVTFEKLPDTDISVYRIVAKQAENQITPACPGGLDFTVASSGTGEVAHSSCSGTCIGSAGGLTNGVTYCVAVRAEDSGGQLGNFGFSAEPVSPERTVGPAGLSGERGCSLGLKPVSGRLPVAFVTLNILFLILARFGKIGMTVFFLACFFYAPFSVKAQSNGLKPESKWFSFELKGGVWIPTNSVVKNFYGDCCNLMGESEFGLLYKSRYNATVAVGFMHETARAVGVGSGVASGDRVGLLVIPIRNNFIFRADFREEQVVVPYAGFGADYVFFRESVGGQATKGFKFGIHGMGGVAFLLDRIEDMGQSLSDAGIDDVYFTFEGRYGKIDSFKSTGLDLSGIQAYAGVLFAF